MIINPNPRDEGLFGQFGKPLRRLGKGTVIFFAALTVGVFVYSGALMIVSREMVDVMKSRGVRYLQDRFNNPNFLTVPYRLAKSYFAPPLDTLYIDIKFKDYQKILKQRQVGLENEILTRAEKKYVPAALRFKNQIIPAKLRLKGTWTDHINTDKWSFTIKVKRNGEFLSMRRFSIQHPLTRNFTREWLFAEAARNEGIATGKYEFIKVVLNGKEKGIYAVEEGMTKEILERQNRREGIILQFDEELRRSQLIGDPKTWPFLSWRISPIAAQNMKQVQESKTLYDQFIAGQAMLERFRKGELPASKVFDCKLFGRYFALLDLFGGGNGTHWNNLRFYYNPITVKLEPIGRDSGTGFLASPTIVGDLASYQYFRAINDPFEPFESFHAQYFSDPETYICYIQEVERMSSDGYLESLLKDLGPAFEDKVGALNREWPVIGSNLDYLRTNRMTMRKAVSPPTHVDVYATVEKTSPDGSREVRVDIGNILSLPVEVYAITLKGQNLLATGKTEILKAKPPYRPVVYAPIRLDISGKFKDEPVKLSVLTRPMGTNQSAEAVAYSPRNPGALIFPDYAIAGIQTLKQFEFVALDPDKKTVTVKPGKWEVQKDLIVPPGHQLNIGPGTELFFGKDAVLLTYSPVQIRGEPERPVLLTSLADRWPGLIVLNAQSSSMMQHVIVEKTKGIERTGWQISGGVTFYKSPVQIEDVEFRDNLSEDAINIVSSEFLMTGARFQNIFSDAFDSDFSDGLVENCSFRSVANDAMDFSGSRIQVKNAFVEKAGDKGVSAGERSFVEISDSAFLETNTGVASKDLSTVNIRNSAIRESQFALAAYQKKPVYGPAKIVAQNVVLEKNRQSEIIEVNSRIEIDGVLHKGAKKNLAELLTMAKPKS